MEKRYLVSTLFVTIVMPVSWGVAAHKEVLPKGRSSSDPELVSYTSRKSDAPSSAEFSLLALSSQIARQEYALQKVRVEVNKAHLDAVDAQHRCIKLVLFNNELNQRVRLLEFQAQLREIEYLGHIRQHIAQVTPLEEAVKSLSVAVKNMQISNDLLADRVALLESETDRAERYMRVPCSSRVSLVERIASDLSLTLSSSTDEEVDKEGK